MCKEKVTLPENSIIEFIEMESEMIDGATDSLSPKVSSLEKETVLEGNDMGDGKMSSGVKVEKEEKGAVLVSCKAPCLERGSDSKGQDVGLLKLGNGKDFDPVTPFVDREIVEVSSSSDQTEEEDAVPGCQTPTESIFNPFAPGPEDLMLAPKKKMTRESKIPLRRQLQFDSCSDSMENVEANASEDAAQEDRFLKLICKSFFDLIVSSELKEISVERLPVESNPSEGFKTPTSLPFLTGVAETCPAAPMRPHGLKARRLSPYICRKLDFGTDLS
ncbi:unknown protein 1-like isoform X1 [Phoenix dactylifera]|uniref:Uncharacterized protein n=1 Tax=Phoenix dactylifera TaxID=42345 RepID=A0A8B7BYI4_PHODC|nr:unknown protein 1-like isoform X1 [Phoenix dactylifera]